MSSERFAEVRTPLLLSILMLLMTQIGYIGIFNPWYETLDEEYVPAKSTALPSGLTFSAMTCGYEVMSDVQGDNGNNDALDIVGNETYPAVQTASNATSVFIQLRLDGSPTNAQGTSLQSFMWGMEFDTDGNKSTYEHLVSYYGSGSDSLKIYNNTVTSTADSPSDSAESVSVELTPASDYWNSSVADSSFGGDDDYLLTMILPWDVLEDHDMDRNGTPSFNWFGTSNSNQNLNGDFACHDGNNDGAPQLTTTASDPVPLDSARRFTFSGGVWSGSSTVYYVNGTQYDSLTFAPTTIPDGATFEVDPALPSGLSVNASGVLSGIPSQIISGVMYTIYANSTVDGVAFSATANIILNVVPGVADFDLWQSVVDGAKLPLNAAMDPITFGYVEGEDASTIEGNGSYWNFTEGYYSATLGNRISTLGDGYDVMFDDDVIMFNDASDLYMHNLSNGTTWNEFSHYGFLDFLYVLDNVLLFDSYSSSTVSELWAYNVSNRTKWNIGGAGFELPSFTLNSNTFNPSPLRVGDDLYLYGEDTNGPGEGLYRFNGTSLELEFLSNSTTPSTSFSNLKNLIHHNGTVYFTAKEFGTYRWELYKHTIATNQTSMLHDVTGGSTSSSNYGFQAQVTMVSDDIIVFGYSGLWAYNITSNTSYQVNSSLGGNLNEAVVVDDVVYFSAGVDRELYAYNLSSNATWMVKNINTNNGVDGLISNEGPDILVRDGKLYFIGLTGSQDINNNYRIWVHDTQENATYSIDNGYNYGSRASWFHGFTRDQLFYYYDATSGYDELLMYDISTNETSHVLREGSSQYGGGYWTFAGDVFVYSGHSGSWDSKMYFYSPEELSVVSFDAVAGASCSISPSLPAGLSLNQGNCTVSGTPTTITSQTSYTLTATISGQTYGATFWLITDYLPLTPSVADLDATVGAPIEPITFGIPTGAKAGDGGYDAPYSSNYSTMLAGDYHSCAVLGDGSMACWGDNQYGQLGDGTTTSSSTPVPVNLPAGSSVASIPAYAADHSCAILDNGSVYCWGLGSAFSTGSSVSTPQHLPLPAGRTPVSIQGDHLSTCVILDNGSMMCVGSNADNRLGYNGSATNNFAYVEYLPQGTIVVDMSLSEKSACALLDDGDVWCWGSNNYEALGVSGGGTTYNYAVQPNIPSGNITAIEGHVRGHCSLYDNGSVACWGSNSNGERGIGNKSTANLANLEILFTQPMPGNLSVTSLATGDHTVCAQLSNGSVACWGDSYANGYSSDTTTPTLIPWPHGSVKATAVSVGWYHGCALLENGSMWCWGQNYYGQLGDGTTTDSVSGTFVDLDQGVRGPPVSMSGATCSVDPALPAGLSMAQGNCTISGTPTGTSSTTTYTVYANTSAGTSRSEISITVVANPMFPSVDGAQLRVDQAMTNITFQYGTGPSDVSGAASCTLTPTLPAGLSVDGSNCTISGTPTAAAVNTTYMVTAEISGTTYAAEIWLEVLGFIGPVVGVNNTLLPDVHPMYTGANLAYEVEPSLPASLSLNATTGVISGTPTETLGNTTFTLYANDTNGDSLQWNISIEILEDTDGDGLPNLLPPDYDGENDDHRPTPGLTEDLDDDNDGLNDTNETDTGSYVDESDTGTDPLDPDTDDDGICDGPNAVPGVCIAGPDTNTGPPVIATPIVLVNNTAVAEIDPFFVVSGATYSLSPSLPTSLQFDASNGSIWGTPDMVMANTSYTMWANLSNGVSVQWTFYLSVLDDFDGDGLPDVLPGDYNGSEDPIRSAPGLEEDLDDDGDGYNDTVETDSGMYLDENNTGTDPRDPDTDDDGICDGPNAVPGICAAGPDTTPFGPTATVVAVNNTAIPNVPPYYVGSGLSYQIMPSLPAGMTIDPATGIISGTPTQTIGNTTFTIFANHTNGNSYSWDFTIEVLEDTDGDGDPDTLPIDYDGNADSIRGPPGLIEDLDDDNDGLPDLNETDTGIWNGEGDTGTDPLNPDTDGDGFCDGPASEVYDRLGNLICRGPDPNPHDPTDPLDTDGDMYPDDDPDGEGGLEADDDDDNDGYPDTSEDACNSDSKNATSIPEDMDGDAICDGDDLDMDGDGIDNLNETGLPIGTDPENPDTDGDGVCDGPESPVTSNCTAGPDAFPLDPSASKDTDGDGKPDDLVPGVNSTSEPALEEDFDDDNDGWDDLDEIACGTDSLNETDIPVDLNGDGICDVLDDDWDDDGIPNANETNTSIYVNETDTGTDPWNPDTDGDGYCDGPVGVMNGSDVVCVAGPDPYPNDPTQPVDTDGDGLPDELPDDYDGELVEDTDDDGDGVEDVDDLYPLNPGADTDTDGDGRPDEVRQDVNTDPSLIEDLFDDDAEDDGWSDLDEIACGTDPQDDTDEPGDIDGDGICDALDTEDNRDDLDGDGWSNVDELLCGTDEDDDSSVPKDSDLDGICNTLDPPILTYTNPNATRQYNTSDMWILLNESIVLTPFLDGILADTWEINGTLPEGLNFTGQARSGDGSIFGTPTELMNMTTYFITASNSLTGESISFMLNLSVVEDTDLDGLPDNDPDGPDGIIEGDLDDDNDGWPDTVEEQCETDSSDQSDTPADLVDDNNQCLETFVGTGDPSDEPFGYGLCFLPLLLLLLLLLLVVLYREREVLVGPEPEYTDAEPKFQSGQGTSSDPFVLKSPKPIKHGESVVSKELITFTNMSPNIKFPISDLGNDTNRTRFKMIDERGSDEGVFEAHGDEEGTSSIRIMFDDSFENTREGGTFQGLLKIGLNSVYVMWEVEVKPDKEYLKELKKQEKEAEKQRKKEEAEAKKKAEADAKAKAEEEAKAEAEAEADAKAEEEAAAAALLIAKKEEEEAEKKAKKEAEAAEKKAKAEAEKEAKAKADAEAKAKAEEEAAAALLIAKKEEEEAEKKAKREAEAKAKAEEEAKAKAEAEAKAKVAAVKPATKEAKKEEEIERVKERAKSIDFKVLGKASTSEVKEEVKKGAETLNVGDASSFEEQGEATISDEQGSMVISWQGKDGNTLTGVKGVTRVIKTKAVLIARNDLQAIKGVGPFIEEKLNALGIYTWRQVANMNAKLEEQVNQAIEFFPGRVKRDQWVAQAKILLGENVKLDEKALKQAEELARVEAKAESIDFATLGVASAADKNDLQKIKGIGPFIEEKLNALGIFTFDQIAKMTPKIEEEVNLAIEFFPGRVKRDEWAKQAKELAKGDKK